MKNVRIDVDRELAGSLRREVFSNQRLNEVQRRREVKKRLQLPLNGSKVELFCNGEFVGTV